MTSWQEKMNAERIRQQEGDGQFDAIHREMERRKIKTTELEKEVEKTILELGIHDTLEGIKQDVWGEDSKIVPFFEEKISDDGKLLVVKKGLGLVYEYDYPSEGKEEIYERRFGRYSSFLYWGGGGLSETPRYPVCEKKFGWHNQEIGYNIHYVRHNRSISTRVSVRGFTPVHGIPDDKVRFRIGFLGVDGLGRDMEQGEKDAPMENIEYSKGWIERFLLQDCISREKNGTLPTNLFAKAQEKLLEIQGKIEGNPYIYGKF